MKMSLTRTSGEYMLLGVVGSIPTANIMGHRAHSVNAYIYIFSDLLVRNGQEFSLVDVKYLGHTGKYEINM